MEYPNSISRRDFLQTGSLIAAGSAVPRRLFGLATSAGPLAEFSYGDIVFPASPQESQLRESRAILMGLGDDELLRPFRMMAGLPAPGKDIGGWYHYDPNYKIGVDDAGFAPGHCFGQWVSALARSYSIDKTPEVRDKVLRLNQLVSEAISGEFFDKTRFPAYTYDKLVCGLIDSQRFANDPNAFSILGKVTDIANPHLPGKAIERDVQWRPGKDFSYGWDESYTMPENLFLAWQRGAGDRYREMAMRYLMDETFFDPLSRDANVLAGRHAYSTVNSLSSGMMAYIAAGSEKHLLAVKNAYDMLIDQSYATGGWGPDEQLRAAGSDDLFKSLTKTHNSFETPCGAYAHFKLTRYLLRVTRDSQYGDSMERVMYNTILGAKPIQENGEAFYYSDYNFAAKRVYSDHIWPCCSGTLPQIAADYRISAYFRDGKDVFVNLYLPSTLKWSADGKDFSLTQQTEYPLEEAIRLKLTATHAHNFAVSLRIPAWADGASVAINGKPISGAIAKGQFLRIDRKWKPNDEIALTLPMQLRLEAINTLHPNVAALLRGPLVLFALGESLPEVDGQKLLSARQVDKSQWIAESGRGTLTLVPFTEVGNKSYSTYVRT